MCGCDTITSGGEEGCEPLRGEELGAAEDDVLQQVGHPYRITVLLFTIMKQCQSKQLFLLFSFCAW